LFFIATADCTGHGVPGAFMSLLNINFLRKNIIERGVIDPAKVLDEQRKDIIQALNPRGDENSKDGMDCVLCCYDLKNGKLNMAAANNPLWLVRNGELISFKGDKMPVGMHAEALIPFEQKEIELQKGDVIYTFTDGFADQFGGPKGKKFKYQQLEELILSNSHLPMTEQRDLLSHTLNNWKGDNEQIDDILVIGMKWDA
jgi:serine phosphatase RsbU (regulator of sigma subunit)